MVNVNKAADIGVNNNKEEMKMKNINNDGVNVNEAVNTRVNNIKEEMKMQKITNNGVIITKEVNNSINKAKEMRLERSGGLHLQEFLELNNIKGEIGAMIDMDEFINQSTSPEEIMPLKGNIKVIKIDNQYITETDLMEPIGNSHYTLPLIYVIENVLSSYVENGDLDEVLMNYTDEIIMSLIYKGEFIYAVLDGEVYWYGRGLVTTDMETVELYIPYLLELEKAADELLGFWTVVNNMDISDREKDEMKGHVFSDELYIFVHQYCREIWWDGGSN